MFHEIAHSVADVTRTFQVNEALPAADSRYVDLARGVGADVRARVRKRLLAKQPGRPLYVSFAGHRGAGKTTELHRLREEVAEQYFVVYFESNVELNPHSFDMEDLLLVISRMVVEKMAELGHPIDPENLKAVTEWFTQVTRTTEVGQTYLTELESQAKIGIDTTYFGALFSRFQALTRSSSSAKDEVKASLRKYPGALLDATNKLLGDAHQKLRTHRHRELLIIIDNMDRYPVAVMDGFLRASGDALTSLKCNLMITPPLSLAYVPQGGGPLDAFQPEVMPAFRTRDRGMAYDELLPEARVVLENVLARRLDVPKVLPDAEARKRLFVASGGAIRELIELVGEASIEVDEGAITLEAVERVVKRRKARVRATIQVQGYARLLSRIAKEKALNEDKHCLELLFARFVFEYNGEGWFDVHPLVAELDGITTRADIGASS